MSNSVSDALLARLRQLAGNSSRPKERNATIDRLVEACDAIASGEARDVIRKGLPEQELHFRKTRTAIKPPRIEEYVRARRAIDARARRKSSWTGPLATTLRKDISLLEYVRARADEQLIDEPASRVGASIDRLVDQIDDQGLRARLRFALYEGQIAKEDLQRLKVGMRCLRPTIDIDSLIVGETPTGATIPATLKGMQGMGGLSIESRSAARTALEKLTSPSFLRRFGLEFNAEHGNIVERRTRLELLSSRDVIALRELLDAGNSSP